MRRIPPFLLSSPTSLLLLFHPPRHPIPLRFFSTPSSPSSPSSPSTMADSINRNPHPDFKSVEATRPDWSTTSAFHLTKTADPAWTFGQGRNTLADTDTGASRPHIAIDPHAADRPAPANYKLLISAVTPRPIALLSTRSADGRATNLAPFSYFNVVAHDPPLFMVSFAAAIADDAKDSLRHLVDSRQCVINIISEPFLEAANATSIDAPAAVSEWPVSGLTPVYDCHTVACPRVKEAVFSVEAQLEFVKEWDSVACPGKKSATTVFVRGTRFWVREDAINAEQTMVDPAILRPMSRLGGITYARVIEAMELTRPKFEKDFGGEEAYKKLVERQA